MKEIALRDKVGKKKQKWKTNGTSRSKEKFTKKKAATVFSRAEIQKKGKTFKNIADLYIKGNQFKY